MTLPFWFPAIRDVFAENGSLAAIWGCANLPAKGFAYLWTYIVKMPPRGEIWAWFVVPLVSILGQWIVLGFLMGIGLNFWRRRQDKGGRRARRGAS